MCFLSAKCSPIAEVPFCVRVERGQEGTVPLERELIISFTFILAKNPTIMILKSTEWDFILLSYFLLPSARKNCLARQSQSCSPAQVRTIVLKQSPQACRFVGKNSKQEFSGSHSSLIQHFSCPAPGLTLSTCS